MIDDQVLRSFCGASFAPSLPTGDQLEKLEDSDLELLKIENKLKAIDTHSVSGFLIFYRGHLINWVSHKQKTIARSSTAAELLAMSENVDAFLVPGMLIEELLDEKETMIVHQDNTSAALVVGSGKSKKLRHVLIHARALLENVERGLLKIEKVPGTLQMADGLTKALEGDKFYNFQDFVLKGDV